MALILNLGIFTQNGGRCVCYHGNGGSGRKFLENNLLSKTHSSTSSRLVWAEKIALTIQIKNSMKHRKACHESKSQ